MTRPSLRPCWTRRATLLAGAAAALTLAGCATPPPTAERFAGMPVGSSATFQRVSSGSYGQSSDSVTWTYGETQWKGQRLLDARNSVGGGTYHDPSTFGIVANLNAAGSPTMSYEPAVALDWPLRVGKTWSSRHTVTLYPSGQTVPYTSEWRVEAAEAVKVPAGRFDTLRVVRVGSDGETETRWVSQVNGAPLIKRLLERSASHRQGAGRSESELVSYRLPAQ
ncbi:MAG TPA: hypothetical protein PLW24_06050 [Burkholderiaceae bacterium]|nr:hypothetical protein [Burkholderiaceae bacterium]